MKRPVNYLNNKDILAEIHKSKSTFSSFVDSTYENYDIILSDLALINDETIQQAKQTRAKLLSQQLFEQEKLEGKKVRPSDCEVSPDTIETTDLVFRIMTFEHIPDDFTRKKNPKTIADTKVRLNFPPFQHWIINEDNNFVCVGKSHWIGGMANGYFSKTHGKATEKLARMWMKLVERYATRGNVRGYTYNDEMRGQATFQLVSIGLQFDESKSQNPFAYYTTAVKNSFVRVLNLEKRHQDIRDDILEMNDLNPSLTRQTKGQFEAGKSRFDAEQNSDPS